MRLLYNYWFEKYVFKDGLVFKLLESIIILMGLMQKTANARKKLPISIDSFCGEIAAYFKEGVENGNNYSGLYLYAAGRLTQSDLNQFRDKIVKYFESNAVDFPVIASTILPDKIQHYDKNDEKNPDVCGWLCIDFDYFMKNDLIF